MAHEAIGIDEVDGALAARRRLLTFPPRLEARYEADQGPVRARRLAVAAFWFAVCYGLFLGIDVRLVPDVFFESAFLHLGVMVPFGFAVALIAGRVQNALLREGASACLTLTSVGTILWTFVVSQSPSAAHYHYLAALPILFGNVVQRPHFPYAAGASVVAVVLYWTVMATSGLPVEVAIAASIEFGATVAVTLVAGYHMERELRSSYLRKLRVEITADRLSHAADELRELSHLDTLTGIANRRRLDAHLEEMADRSLRGGMPLAVLMLDVDHFKGFNDHYGHPEGDRCLKMVAGTACEQVRRKDDLIGRFGGEEFLVILPGTDLVDAAKVGERIRHAIASRRLPHAKSQVADHVTVSIGVAAARLVEGVTPEELVRAADNALYEAKRLGRNRIHASTPGFTIDVDPDVPRARRVSLARDDAGRGASATSREATESPATTRTEAAA